ncbi:MAG: PHP domain-containing protein, partial [Chloroflexota bacterium]
YGYAQDDASAREIVLDAGCDFASNDIDAVVDAAHKSGAVCLIAHPGRRRDGFAFFDADAFDQLRQEIPIDGFEIYYPAHMPEQIATYLAYAQKHSLLISSGSDSHGPDKKPIQYRAELSRSLLERLGIQINPSIRLDPQGN